MLFRQADLDAIAAGERQLAFRRWRRPTVRAGGTLKTSVGLLSIDAVERISPTAISQADAKSAGFASRAELLEALSSREGDLYRIQFHLAGPDPRIALRRKTTLSADELDTVAKRLARLDAVSARGAWTLETLALIDSNPGRPARDLALLAGRERDSFKTDVRKLKNLGLTISLDVGYKLAPRGRRVLKALRC